MPKLRRLDAGLDHLQAVEEARELSAERSAT